MTQFKYPGTKVAVQLGQGLGARRPTRGRGTNRDINGTRPYAPKQRLARRIKKM